MPEQIVFSFTATGHRDFPAVPACGPMRAVNLFGSTGGESVLTADLTIYVDLDQVDRHPYLADGKKYRVVLCEVVDAP